MLYATDPKTNKENKHQPVGRFAFKLNPGGTVRASNLDFTGGGSHMHPNLAGDEICLGNTRSNIERFVREGNYFEAVDLLILFFSLFPQDQGSPYCDPMEWLRTRISVPRSNPYRGNNPLYRTEGDTKKVFKRERKTALRSLTKTINKALGKNQKVTRTQTAIEEIAMDEVPF